VPGIEVTGTGESVGEQVGPDGNASAALKFASDNWWSLIREGSGYWKYVPVLDGVRFLTWYDYEVRFGRLGRTVDAAAFRPLIGWATAVGVGRDLSCVGNGPAARRCCGWTTFDGATASQREYSAISFCYWELLPAFAVLLTKGWLRVDAFVFRWES
jgi:hypothetical protein